TGNVIRNTPGSCVSRTGINVEHFGGRIERNSIVGYVQPCAGPGPRALPGAIWVGSIAVIHPQVTPVVRFNDISGNAQAGLRLGPNQTTPIDARCNYWGSASGPSGAGIGTGDAIVVETGAAAPGFAPWATAPIAHPRRLHDDGDDDDRGGRDRCHRDPEWSEPVNLGPTVNSPFVDIAPKLSPNGLSLYFVSNRPGGVGDVGNNDIWVSRRASLASPWEAPVNLGPIVNSGRDDGGPSVSADGHLLFFNSNRLGGVGAADLYMSRRDDPNDDFGWGPPINLGPLVNTTAGERGPEYFAGADGSAPTLYFNRGDLAAFQADLYAAPISRN